VFLVEKLMDSFSYERVEDINITTIQKTIKTNS
jgi:anti-sigma regulatory factor (Ser/Thr protein kinase)